MNLIASNKGLTVWNPSISLAYQACRTTLLRTLAGVIYQTNRSQVECNSLVTKLFTSHSRETSEERQCSFHLKPFFFKVTRNKKGFFHVRSATTRGFRTSALPKLLNTTKASFGPGKPGAEGRARSIRWRRHKNQLSLRRRKPQRRTST